MPRRSRAESEATAAAVLDAAERRFGEHGYAAVRLDEVATDAGVTRGAVYHHFGSKTGLFEAVLARVQAAVGRTVVAAAETEPGPWRSLEVGCLAFLQHSLAGSTRRIMLVDAPAVLGWSTWRQQDAAESGRHLVEAVEELTAAGATDVTSVPAMSALISGALNEAALWVAAQDDVDAALDEARASVRVLLRGLARRPG